MHLLACKQVLDRACQPEISRGANLPGSVSSALAGMKVGRIRQLATQLGHTNVTGTDTAYLAAHISKAVLQSPLAQAAREKLSVAMVRQMARGKSRQEP